MVDCAPVCTIPSYASTPTVGLGSVGTRGFGKPRYVGPDYSVFGYGGGALTESTRDLGILSGVQPSCINQTPPSEVLIQPAPLVICIPGPILTASCEPVYVGGNTPCAAGGYGLAGGLVFANQGFGFGGLGRGYLGSNHSSLSRGSICH